MEAMGGGGGVITGVMAAGQGAMGFMEAKSGNSIAADNQRRINEAGEVAQAELSSSSGLERMKRMRANAKVEGRLRVALAGSGDATGEALARQNINDSEADRRIIQTNNAVGIRSIRSGVAAQQAANNQNFQDPLMAGFQGAAGGAAQGIQIAGATGPDGLKWWGA